MKPKSKKIIFIIILISTNVVTGLLVFTLTNLYLGLNRPKKEIIPREILFSSVSPDGSQTALILHGDDGSFFYSDELYLALKQGEATYIIDRELLEGYGGYESGVHDITWIDNNQIQIIRDIADVKQTIRFDLSKNQWSDLQE
jgi:hypothetical protein